MAVPHLCMVLLLTFAPIPAVVAICSRSIPSASAGKGKPRDPHLLGKKQKVGELTGTEGHTDQCTLCEDHTKEIPFLIISFERHGLQGRQQGTSTSRLAILRSSRLLLVWEAALISMGIK